MDIKEQSTLFIEQYLPKIAIGALNVVLALLIFFIGAKLIKQIRKRVRQALEFKRTDHGVVSFIDSLLKVALYILLILILLRWFGFEITSISALVASSGLTLGLALQGSLSNFAGGVLILFIKPFQVGDYIKETTGGNEGTVNCINLFYTTMLTLDNKRIMVPNGTLANASIVNYTAQGIRRVEVMVGVSYHADLKLAKKVAREALEKNPYRLQAQASEVVVTNLGDSSVDLKCMFWVNSGDYFNAFFLATEEIKLALDENNIEIPFPQVTVSYEQQQ